MNRGFLGSICPILEYTVKILSFPPPPDRVAADEQVHVYVYGLGRGISDSYSMLQVRLIWPSAANTATEKCYFTDYPLYFCSDYTNPFKTKNKKRKIIIHGLYMNFDIKNGSLGKNE